MPQSFAPLFLTTVSRNCAAEAAPWAFPALKFATSLLVCLYSTNFDGMLATKRNMTDLDEFARSKRYFRHKNWRGARGSVDYNAIVRGIRELGGTVHVEWSDQ